MSSDSSIRTTNSVAIPANAYLHFNHAFGFEDDAERSLRRRRLEYSTAGAAGPWTDAGALFTAAGGCQRLYGTIFARHPQPP